MVICKCKVCGKEFNTPPSHIKRGQGKYCSKECSAEGRSNYELKTCLTCGRTFKAPKYYTKRGQMNYCSQKCWYYTIKGKGNPSYTTGKQIGYSFTHSLSKNIPCESCGTLNDIHIHHQNLDHGDNGYSNLIWLCRGCHSRLHRLWEHLNVYE